MILGELEAVIKIERTQLSKVRRQTAFLHLRWGRGAEGIPPLSSLKSSLNIARMGIMCDLLSVRRFCLTLRQRDERTAALADLCCSSALQTSIRTRLRLLSGSSVDGWRRRPVRQLGCFMSPQRYLASSVCILWLPIQFPGKTDQG